MDCGSHIKLKGLIMLWSGSIASIPAGWTLCDGNNGAPNLTDKFIVGAGNTYDPADTGGSTTHTHTASGQIPTESLQEGTVFIDSSPDGDYADSLPSDEVNVTVNTGSSLSPYYALAYIMKT